MATSTTRLGLRKPEGTDNINVTTDVSDNADKIDAAIGMANVTSSTRPASPFTGQLIRESDTGKLYVWTGSVWSEMVVAGVNYGGALTFSGGTITVSGLAPDLARSSAAEYILLGRVTGDSLARWGVFANGKFEWGPGTGSRDTFLYRAGAGWLKTDGRLIVGENISVTGDATIAGAASVGGLLTLGTAGVRTQLSTSTLVANTTTETAVASLLMPTADQVAGSVWRIDVWGLASVTGTPTLTFRGKIGSTTVVNSGAVTASSGVSSHPWHVTFMLDVATTGSGGTVDGLMEVRESLSVAGSSPFVPASRQIGAAGVSASTLVDNTMTVTVQWSAASASNSTKAYAVTAERLA